MTVTIQASGLQEMEQLLHLIKSLNINDLRIDFSNKKEIEPTITKGDKSINPTELFGIWKDSPKTTEDLRSNNWKRNWDL
jgi:hypothetical protein